MVQTNHLGRETSPRFESSVRQSQSQRKNLNVGVLFCVAVRRDDREAGTHRVHPDQRNPPRSDHLRQSSTNPCCVLCLNPILRERRSGTRRVPPKTAPRTAQLGCRRRRRGARWGSTAAWLQPTRDAVARAGPRGAGMSALGVPTAASDRGEVPQAPYQKPARRGEADDGAVCHPDQREQRPPTATSTATVADSHLVEPRWTGRWRRISSSGRGDRPGSRALSAAPVTNANRDGRGRCGRRGASREMLPAWWVRVGTRALVCSALAGSVAVSAVGAMEQPSGLVSVGAVVQRVLLSAGEDGDGDGGGSGGDGSGSGGGNGGTTLDDGFVPCGADDDFDYIQTDILYEDPCPARYTCVKLRQKALKKL